MDLDMAAIQLRSIRDGETGLRQDAPAQPKTLDLLGNDTSSKAEASQATSKNIQSIETAALPFRRPRLSCDQFVTSY